MKTKCGYLMMALLVVSVGFTGCGDGSTPTSSSPALTQLSSTETTVGTSRGLATSSSQTEGPFTCDEMMNVQVRFGSPGFHKGRAVGIFVEYEGAPPGDKKLEITWDELNAPGDVSRMYVGEGDRRNDGLTDLLGIASHFYDAVTETEQKQVRINLLVEGRSGQCARVRRVNVAPSTSSFDTTVASLPVPPNYILLEPLAAGRFNRVERNPDPTTDSDPVEIEGR